MTKMTTCHYCGRSLPRKEMIESRIYRGKWICRIDITACMRIRTGGAVWARNDR